MQLVLYLLTFNSLLLVAMLKKQFLYGEQCPLFTVVILWLNLTYVCLPLLQLARIAVLSQHQIAILSFKSSINVNIHKLTEK